MHRQSKHNPHVAARTVVALLAVGARARRVVLESAGQADLDDALLGNAAGGGEIHGDNKVMWLQRVNHRSCMGSIGLGFGILGVCALFSRTRFDKLDAQYYVFLLTRLLYTCWCWCLDPLRFLIHDKKMIQYRV
jgi:hypothetical protein